MKLAILALSALLAVHTHATFLPPGDVGAAAVLNAQAGAKTASDASGDVANEAVLSFSTGLAVGTGWFDGATGGVTNAASKAEAAGETACNGAGDVTNAASKAEAAGETASNGAGDVATAASSAQATATTLSNPPGDVATAASSAQATATTLSNPPGINNGGKGSGINKGDVIPATGDVGSENGKNNCEDGSASNNGYGSLTGLFQGVLGGGTSNQGLV